jgi:transglutaminase-like putative cysteine protease
MSVDRGRRVVVAELALTAVTAAVGFGAIRLFTGFEWVVPVALTVLVVHGLSALARRNRIGIPLQALVVALTEAFLLAGIFASDTFRFVIPTGATFTTLGDALEEAIDAYPTARAPVDATDGFVIAFCIGLAIVALMADIAAFSLRAPLQALIPPFTLFALCSLLGTGDKGVITACAFLVASLSFVLSVRSLDQATSTTWMPGDQTRGPNALMRLGAILIGIAACGAVVIGPALPGAADDGLWTWRGGGGPGSRFVISPLVDLRARLVNQSRDIAFVVESPRASYWRLTSLDTFDGTTWTNPSNFRDVDGQFNEAGASDTATRQSFDIRALNGEFLPAAFDPIEINNPSEDVSFDERSSTFLLEDRDTDLYSGFTYQVASELPDVQPDELRAADGQPQGAIARRYTELPDIDPEVEALAEQVTAGAATDYDRLVLLQNWFRTEFEYSQEIPAGSDGDALANFVLDERVGYCEQFAASFAVMARSLGIPSRVALGFTQGEPSPRRPELFTVRMGNAHAWPEVYFRGVGWVPFEPTPTRAAPGTEAWTTIPDGGEGPSDDAAVEDPAAEPAPPVPPDIDPQLPEFDTGPVTGSSAPDSGPTIPMPVRVLLGATAIVGGWLALVSGAAALRRTRRRTRVADDPAARVELSWTEAVEALARQGRVPRDSETRSEYAARIGVSSPSSGRPLTELGELSAVARYSDEIPRDDDVTRAIELSAEVVTASTHHLPWYRRLAVAGDPRRLVSPRPRRARRSATVVSAT